MNIDLIVFASPFFILLIAIESWTSLKSKSSLYHLNDSVNNFSTGILEEIAVLPFRGLILYSYYYISEHYAILHPSSHSILSWFSLWLFVDFCYYWFHRTSHRCTFFWIGHSVHHQSEHYNFSVALRQGFFQSMTSWVFYLPIALIGFPAWMFIIMVSLNTIYQFWIHTQRIKTLGWLEHLFNTPSHHRVHHGKNPQYIDKNYAGSLIIWDKLFGTFEPEQAPVEYGVTEPLDSWNPFYANIKVITDMLYYGQFLKNKLSIVKSFIMPPEWIIKKLESEGATPVKRNVISLNTQSPVLYMLWNTSFTLFLYAYLSTTFHQSLNSWIIGIILLLTLYMQGKMANHYKPILPLEFIRSGLIVLSLTLLSKPLLIALLIGFIFFIINYLLYQKTLLINNHFLSQLEKLAFNKTN